MILTKVTQDGVQVPLLIPERNFIEANPKQDSDHVWVKYWDGKEIRAIVITETLEQLDKMVK